MPPSGAATLCPSIPASVPDSPKWCRCTELLTPRKLVFTSSLIVLSNIGSFHCHGNTAFCLGENNHLEFTFVIWYNTTSGVYFHENWLFKETWSLPIHQHNTSIHLFFSSYIIWVVFWAKKLYVLMCLLLEILFLWCCKC